ncbi:MAG: Amylo-alpha,6-glucosidase [Nocardioides sp.]|nr:Amylo-alpha,6-glucosidase [Nocardioides sp.]
MTSSWNYVPRVSGDIVTALSGSCFCVSGPTGEIDAGAPQGLFVHDTRIVSTWRLWADYEPIDLLRSMTPEPYHAVFFGRTRSGTADAPSSVVVRIDRYVGTGMREDITVRNVHRHPVRCTIDLGIGADLADLFEVKEGRGHIRAEVPLTVLEHAVAAERRQGDHRRGVQVRARDAVAHERGLRFDVEVPGRGEWRTTVEVHATIDGDELPSSFPPETPVDQALPARRMSTWRRSSPRVLTQDLWLQRILWRSMLDLGALRIFDPGPPDTSAVAAGAPWFMALFGRDSLISSYFALPLDPSLALGTAQTLARMQGSKVDRLTEEQPGRILHEVRLGATEELMLGGGRIYYGTADATPLFVVLVGELRRWGLHPSEVAALWPHMDRALAWIEDYGDLDGDGFVEYQRTSERGLVNQGWKDSADGITFADGRVAKPPIALCEVQAYVYAAYLTRAHLARESGEESEARHWADKSDRLKRRFNQQFWLPDRGWYALGLDADKRPIDSLASNQGHALWAGIVDTDKAPGVARALMSTDMFTGWGVRTLGESMGAYNPMSYHNGSVWPHDSAFAAAGLMRYGFVTEAQRIAQALLDGAMSFDGRLPELMCGFSRSELSVPIPYPTSCSPQAWASAAPIHLLRTLLRFEPWMQQRKVWMAPALPTELGTIHVEDLRLDSTKVHITATAERGEITGLPDDIQVVREARSPLTSWFSTR